MRLIDADKLMSDIEYYHLSDGKFQHWVEIQNTIDPEPHWIPCSERLPEMHTDVLTFDTYGNIWICSLIFTGRNNEACWEDDYGYLHNFDERIAWMPLPEPYEPESEESE